MSRQHLIQGDQQHEILCIGLVADVQYADVDDILNEFSHKWRYYRRALDPGLVDCIAFFNENLDADRGDFCINLGDLVDMRSKDKSEAALVRAMEVMRTCKLPFYHTLGNHEICHMLKHRVLEIMGINSNVNHADKHDPVCYYSFKVNNSNNNNNKFRVVIMDSFDISIHGFPPGHPKITASHDLVGKHNPNPDKNYDTGMVDRDRRFVLYNGGIGATQLEWLDRTLAEAQTEKEKVLIFAHVPFHDAMSQQGLAWNYEQVLEIIYKFGNKVVAACFYGHLHESVYHLDSHGIHHICVEALLETPHPKKGCGIIKVYHDHIDLVGADDSLTSRLCLPTDVLTT